ncbi:MAG: hypothetical protein WKF57_19335 [Nakamurella sp.]
MADHAELDPSEALALIDAESDRVRRALDVRLPVQLMAWGIAWLIGFGALWWDVHRQQPFTGPGVVSAVVFGVLLIAAAVITGVVTAAATRGRGGRSVRQGRDLGIFWGAGFTAFFVFAGGIGGVGLDPEAAGLLFAGGSVILTGLAYLAMAAVFGGAVERLLGGWLLLLVAAGVWTGPVTLNLLIAVLGGGAFLLAAVVTWRRGLRRPEGRATRSSSRAGRG